MFHAPWYNSNRGHFKEAERQRWFLERTLYDGGVDFVLNGHVHAYERSRAVFDWKTTPCGPTHLVVGDGGNYEGPYGDGVARAAAGLVGVTRRQLRRGAAGDRERDGRELDVAQDDVRRDGGSRASTRPGTRPWPSRARTPRTPPAARTNPAAAPTTSRRRPWPRWTSRASSATRRSVRTAPARAERAAPARGRARASSRDEARDGGDARKADAFFEAFLGAGWAATAAALAWALAALRRERRGAGAFRHAQLQLGDDDDTL